MLVTLRWVVGQAVALWYGDINDPTATSGKWWVQYLVHQAMKRLSVGALVEPTMWWVVEQAVAPWYCNFPKPTADELKCLVGEGNEAAFWR